MLYCACYVVHAVPGAVAVLLFSKIYLRNADATMHENLLVF